MGGSGEAPTEFINGGKDGCARLLGALVEGGRTAAQGRAVGDASRELRPGHRARGARSRTPLRTHLAVHRAEGLT